MTTTGPIRVADDQRRLIDAEGNPFFWCGDTAWNLFASLTLDQARHYLTTRAAQGFNVIQAVGYFEHDCRNRPAHMGQWVMHDMNPAKPNDAYFDHVQKVMDIAESLGLHFAFLPTWGHLVTPMWAGGDSLFTPENAMIYGEYVGKRFGGRANLIWVNGGDRPVNTDTDLLIWRNLANGIRSTESVRHLMTFHISGSNCSSNFVHDEPWLDMNMQQSGHAVLFDRVDQRIAQALSRYPRKPVLDGEICYEDHPIGFRAANGRFTDWHVRASAYRSVFGGGCGVTYGAAAVWCFYSGRYPAILGSLPSMDWKQSLHLPGASQMNHLHELMQRFADKALIPCDNISNHSAADSQAPCMLRDGSPDASDAGCILIYQPTTTPFGAYDLTVMRSEEVCATYFDPRTGKSYPAGVYRRDKQVQLKNLPDSGPDWVVIFEAL
ncbi:MAG TPA: hypothetical protein DCM28_04525 [Phycisphaerales bacterium]|nr:hypothetical protein [Phycisphaerales bacterium]HCD33378.1 hypothetical protein [Phycisphaerales bacterium]|tara:strand:- start:27983 stop:29290 length:1308 start_codon:yes stop_codon:yes gene_type:complete